MAGNAVFQFQKGLQKLPFGVAKEFPVSAGLAAADDGASGNDQDVMERMPAGIAGPGAFQFGE